MDEHNRRDELFERLKYGELDPEAAEAEARRLGLAPLRPDVDRSHYDPARENQWTLTMAVAWIAFRTIDAVRDAWDVYRAECWDWIFRKWRLGLDGDVTEGWLLEQRPPATIAVLLIGDSARRDADRDPKFSMTCSEAKGALWDALQTDCFRASGVDHESRERVQILPTTWIDLKLFEERGKAEVRPNALDLNSPHRYQEVLLPSAALRGLWREPHLKPTLTLPGPILPTGDGYMPLTSAAQWIATQGGSATFPADDIGCWRPAFDQLLAAIGSDRVRVVGTKDGGREPVAGYHFVDCPIEYPYQEPDFDSIVGEHVYLRTYTYDSEEEWRDGFSDALVKRGRAIWNRLVVAKADVLEIWPFGLQPKVITGLPGRPSSRHLIHDEFSRRVESGEFHGVLTQEAQYLASWLSQTYPNQPPARVGTIKNMIRDVHRAARSTK